MSVRRNQHADPDFAAEMERLRQEHRARFLARPPGDGRVGENADKAPYAASAQQLIERHAPFVPTGRCHWFDVHPYLRGPVYHRAPGCAHSDEEIRGEATE